MVPYTAGGFTDQMARLLTVGLQKQLGQPVVIDNKPGANSIIGGKPWPGRARRAHVCVW